MAQWTNIDPNTLLPCDPWTSAKAQAAFENLEAVTEGAAIAPRIAARAIGPVRLPPLTTSGTSAAGYVDLDPLAFMNFHANLQTNGTNRTLQIRVSNNNGSSYGSWESLSQGVNNGGIQYAMQLNLRTGRMDAIALRNGLFIDNFFATLNRTNINALQFRNSNSDAVSRILSQFASRG